MLPLVSVMTPCYNSADLLPVALSSLLAQTYENWECLLVDDGSTDDPESVASHISDPRIHYIKLKKNMGRAFARQKALNEANGEYLTMLDADDWIYPDKLQRQVELIQQRPTVALISAGMAIVDSGNQIVGASKGTAVKAQSSIKGPLTNLILPPIAHAPSMIRMEVAKRTTYDRSLFHTEDIDFLINILLDRRYYEWPIISYAYRLNSQANQSKSHIAYRELISIFQKHTDRFPIESRLGIITTVLKYMLKVTAISLGFGNKLIANRYRNPTHEERDDFRHAWQVVSKMHRVYFG